jgi:3-oxoadipate enol-lactonase
MKRRNNRNFAPMLRGDVDAVAANWAKDPYLIMPGKDAARDQALASLKASPQNIRHLVGDPARPGPSALPRMPGLKVPTLILAGDHDNPDVHAMAGVAQAMIPGARRVVLADTGHLVQLERPGELAALVADFVRTGR